MTIPNLPTDNLYKFIFIGGLTLVIASCILLVTQYNLLSEKIDAHKVSTTELETELSILEKDLKFINKDLARLEKKLKTDDTIDIVTNLDVIRERLKKDKDFREYYSFLLEHKEDLLPYYKDIAQLEIMINRGDSLERKSSINHVILQEKLKLLRKENRSLILFSLFSLVCMVVGYVMARNGYKKWLTLVQEPADEKIRLELIQLKESLGKKLN